MNRRPSRRAFVSGLAALAASSAIAFKAQCAHAQQSAPPRRIGVLLVARSPEGKEAQAFRQALRDAGYSEGRDVVIEWRFTNGDYARVPELAAGLIQLKMEVIVVDSTVATRLLKRATSTIPIVMTSISDPVGSGLVASLAHPGGNITGLSIMTPELSAKRLQLLKETIPNLTQVALLWNPDSPPHTSAVQALKAAAPSLSIKLNFVEGRTPEEVRIAFSTIGRTHAQALYIIEDSMYYANRTSILKLAAKGRLPTVSANREFAGEGGLMSYGPNFSDMYQRSAGYVDKILKGAKPADLPIEQPTKFDLAVNLKTADALGLSIPRSILLQADEVIR